MRYWIYGLCLSTNMPFPLPELTEKCQREPDLRFLLNCADQTLLEKEERVFIGGRKDTEGQYMTAVYRGKDSYLIKARRFPDLYVTRDGRRILCYPPDGTPKEHIWALVFGLGFSFALHRQGIPSLHSSAVACRNQAIAFVGFRGVGKSTLAACFLKEGHALVTDEMLPTVERQGKIYGIPSFPGMKIWPETAGYFLGDWASLPRVVPEIEKRRICLDGAWGSFYPDPLPLRAIYLLEAGDTRRDKDKGFTLIPLPSGEALIALTTHTSGISMLETMLRMRLLNFYAHIVTQIPIRRLTFPRGFDLLPAVRSAILEDLARTLVR